MLKIGSVSAVETARHHAVWKAAEKHRLAVRVVDVGENRTVSGIRREWPLVVLRRLHGRS